MSNKSENIVAYRQGVRDTLALAKKVADGLRPLGFKPTRLPFAVAALDEFAKAAMELLLEEPPASEDGSAADFPHSPRPSGPRPPSAALNPIETLSGDLARPKAPPEVP